MGKYFQVEVKPTIDVAALAAGNITTAEVLFDWASFDVPKGAVKLIGITVLYRGKNGADYTPTDFELFFAKGEKHPNSNGVLTPITLGDDGAAVDTPGWFHLLQGKVFVDYSGHGNDADLIYGNILTPGRYGGRQGAGDASNSGCSILQGEPNSGTNVGYDKLYVSSVAQGTHNWGASTMQVSTETATSTPIVIVKTLDALTSLGPGDILRDEDNQALGTVKTVDSATQVTLEENCASVSAVNKLVYNTTPITLLLSFEQ